MSDLTENPEDAEEPLTILEKRHSHDMTEAL